MKECQKVKKDLVAFLYGELGAEEERRIRAHLESCPGCRNEAQEISRMQKESDSLSLDLTEAMAAVDWDTLPDKIADSVFEIKPKSRRSWLKSLQGFVFQPKMRLVYAGLILGLFIGSLATYFALRSPRIQIAGNQNLVFTNDFLEKAELEVARRETLDYLEKSQYLLLDFVQSSSDESSNFWKDELALQRARDLLSKKKFINPQLDKFRMAKAKKICDQIELLFYELIQMSDYLAPEDLERIQNLIEEKQLMLRIKLVKKELKKSEV